MSKNDASDELLNFFKVLADANRLKIVGLLAQQPYSVEQLAALLGLGVSTVSHHLSRLSQAGLVTARAEQYSNMYSLQTDVLTAMARRLLSKEDLPKLAQDVDLDTFDRKVLANFSNPDGSFKAFPAQEKKYRVLVRHVLQAFKPGVKYTEKQVNQILARYHEDTARLRRDLVEYHWMERDTAVGGSKYWRVEE